MRFAVILCVCVLALTGCGAAAGDGSTPEGTTPDVSPTPASSREQAPQTARVVCERDGGTRLLTPEVRARPDGVHFEISNRLGKDTGYAVETPDGGGMGGNAPKGESRRVGVFPPGKVRIGCYPSRNADLDYTKLTVLAGDSGYKSVELECPGGRAVTGMDGVAGDVAKIDEDPVAFVRHELSGRLEEGDVVGAAGYPESRDERAVRVIRDGRVIFTVSYHREGGGWLEESFFSCEGF